MAGDAPTPSDTAPDDKLKVFVSYSRADVAFADQLVLALEDKGFDAILDRHDIDAAEEWKTRLGDLILSCDTVVFVLTPTSAASEICAWEVDYAAQLGKRMIPVTPAPVSGVTPPEALSGLNYIPFYSDASIPGSGPLAGAIKLEKALKTDFGWMRRQTRLQERAAQYLANRVDALLMRDEELAGALDWAQSTPKGHAVLPELSAYIDASQQAEANRKAEADANLKEREQALETARKASRRIRAVGLIGAAVASVFLCVALTLGWFAVERTADVERQSANIIAREAKALFETESGDHTTSLLMALQADPSASRNALRRYFDGKDGYAFARARMAAGQANNQLRQVLQGHEGSVISVAFSPDGTRLATGSWDDTARIWDVATGKSLAALQGHENFVTSVAFSPDGTHLATGSYDDTARIWDIATGESIAVLQGHERLVTSVAFSPDGTRLATGSDDGTARIWDVETGEPFVVLQGHEGFVNDVAFSPDGTRLATGSGDGTARIWDLETGEGLAVLQGHESIVWSVAFSPDGTRLATGSVDRTARIWDLKSGEGLAVLQGHEGEGEVSSVAFSPDGTRLATGSVDRTARIWDLETGEPIAVLQGHEGFVTSVAFSPDGTRLATGSVDRTARIWDLKSGEPVAVLQGHANSVNSVAFSPDGIRLATGSLDRTARIWDLETGEPIAVLQGHEGEGDVWSVAFSPDGTRLATGSSDTTARIWDLETGEGLAVLQGHEGFVNDVAFSPYGTRLATGSDDGTARIWDVETGEGLAALQGHESIVRSVAFSPDGTRLATGSDDTTARIWDLSYFHISPREQVATACETLHTLQQPLAFTIADAVTYPVLQDEPIDPDTGDFVSPCKGFLPDEAFE